MHAFRVIKKNYGWAVQFGDGMSTHYWSQALAIRGANRLCEALRKHGVAAEVIIEEEVIEAAGNPDLGGMPNRSPLEANRHAAGR